MEKGTAWERPLEGEEPDFIIVDQYRPDESEPDCRLRGNPMAMVFPPPMDDEELLLEIQKPKKRYPVGWKTWGLSARLSLLEHMGDCHLVFVEDLDVVGKCVSMVRATLIDRDPRNPRVMNAIAHVMAGKAAHVTRIKLTSGGGGLGMLVTGPSGVGKSSTKDRIKKHLGAYGRIHTKMNGEPARWPQLGVIAINVESTWKETQRTILAEINRQLGRSIYVASGRATGADLEQMVRSALSVGWAPMLIVDEIQRLASLTDKVAKEILEGMIVLMEGFGIPVMLIGTMRVRRLFRRHQAEFSKFASGGTREFKPLEESDANTVMFIAVLKSYAVSTTPVHYCEDFDRLLLAQTMGVRRVMVEFMRCVLTRHALDEKVEANAALLSEISQYEMKDFQLALSALRKTKLGMKLDFADYQEYEDNLEDATRTRTQTSKELRLQVEWKAKVLAQPETELTAADYLAGKVRLAEMERLDQLEPAKRPPQKNLKPRDSDKKLEKAPRSASKTARQRAKTKVEVSSRVTPLGALRNEKLPPVGGIDPSDIT